MARISVSGFGGWAWQPVLFSALRTEKVLVWSNGSNVSAGTTVAVNKLVFCGSCLVNCFYPVATNAAEFVLWLEFLAAFCAEHTTLPLPVYANYADAKWDLMPKSYLDLVFNSIIGVHFTNKKDGPCRCSTTHTTLTQTLSGQRRAEPDFTSGLSLTAEVFFVGLSE